MKEFGPKGVKWLKIVHLVLASLWLGGAIALTAMQYGMRPAGDGALHGIDESMRFIDDFIIIPGAVGSLLTGLFYGVKTRWGFFRHRWVTVKWILTVSAVVFGTFWLGPWLNAMGPISARMGLAALADPAYAWLKDANAVGALIQCASLLFMVGLSVLKPWEARRRD